jgi:hypothetical protein
VLDTDEINELEQSILEVINERLLISLIKANRGGELSTLLNLLGMEDLLTPSFEIKSLPMGKIVVFGDSAIPQEQLAGIAKSLGIRKDRLEFNLDYMAVQKYDYRKFENTSKYCVILIGPIPHMTTGTDGYASLISALEAKNRIIPAKIKRLENTNSLKITKTSFRKALEELIWNGDIAV